MTEIQKEEKKNTSKEIKMNFIGIDDRDVRSYF